MPQAAASVRNDIERQLAMAQSVWRAGRVEAAGKDEGLWQNKKVAEAESKLRALVARCEASLGPDDIDVSGACYGMLATVVEARGRPEEAVELQRKALAGVEDALRGAD